MAAKKNAAPPKEVSTPATALIPTDDGWESLAGGQEAEGFLKKADLTEGAVVTGKLLDARLLADDGPKGGYRVVYGIQLARPVGSYDSGAFVLLGEKHKLRALRGLPLGSDVTVKVGPTIALKGGRTMVTLDVRVKRNPLTGAKSVQEHLTDTWKGMGGAGDVWNRVADDSDAAPF